MLSYGKLHMQFEIEARFVKSNTRRKGLSPSLSDVKGAIAEGGSGASPSGHGENILRDCRKCGVL